MKKYLLSALLCFSGGDAISQTIAEKFASSSKSSEAYGSLDALIRDANEQLIAKRAELDECYQKARQLYAESASEESFRELLNHVNGIKASIRALEAKCHDMA